MKVQVASPGPGNINTAAGGGGGDDEEKQVVETELAWLTVEGARREVI